MVFEDWILLPQTVCLLLLFWKKTEVEEVGCCPSQRSYGLVQWEEEEEGEEEEEEEEEERGHHLCCVCVTSDVSSSTFLWSERQPVIWLWVYN